MLKKEHMMKSIVMMRMRRNYMRLDTFKTSQLMDYDEQDLRIDYEVTADSM
jgi:hypothetical protein